ncbi:MAG: hypothetical protein JEZ03_17260 [Bacteroidales bacterium]|nr:hypothetical protein [Bacteroidales bacterium]
MKRIFTLFLLFTTCYIFAQEKQEEKKQIIQFSGHIKYEAYFDTYESVYSREGNIYLYPKAENLDKNGIDLNKYNQLNMLSAQSRLRAKINGPEAFGAKVNGMVEVDFLGKAASTSKGDAIDLTQTPRIRHMFMSLSWEKTQLIMGQTWHPIFVTECFPTVLGMGAALPFNPLSRAPQIQLKYKLTENIVIAGAALSHLDFASSGPATAQKYSAVPDFHASIKYLSDNISGGIIGGYKILKPRLVTSDTIQTTKTIGSYDVQGFIKVSAGNLTFKALGIYGQNLSSYVMIGGYGASQDPTSVDDYNYSNINTMAVWGEVSYKLNAAEFGLFAGYSANVGSSESNYYSLSKYTRSADIDNILRISPRFSYTMGKVQLGLEYMMTSATYMTLENDKYKAVTTADAVTNNRLYFSASYTF